jgi:hypothetical protein
MSEYAAADVPWEGPAKRINYNTDFAGVSSITLSTDSRSYSATSTLLSSPQLEP